MKLDKKIIAFLLLTISVFSIYSKCLSYSPIGFDLGMYFIENPYVKSGITLEVIRWAFTSFHFNWHPITWLSHMLDVNIFSYNTAGYYFSSITFHLLNSYLLYLIISKFSKNFKFCILVALFFAIHPLNIEPVLWFAARKDLLACFFGLISILIYINHIEKPKFIKILSSVIFFSLSLMSKASFITLPLLLILIDLYIFKVFRKSFIFNKIPYFLISFLSLLLTIKAQAQVGAIASLDTISTFERIINSFISYGEYIIKYLFPYKYSIFYPYRESIITLENFISLLALIIIILLALKSYKNRKYITLCFCWFVINLFPMIGLLQIGNHSLANRYAYISTIGIHIIICSLVLLKEKKWLFAKALPYIYVPIFLLSSFSYSSHWKDSLTIYQYSITNTNNFNPILYSNIGYEYLQNFYKTKNKQNLVAAIEAYEFSLKQNINATYNFKNLGDAYLHNNQPNMAIINLRKFLAYNPNNLSALNNLGIAYLQIGDKNLAEKSFKEALRIDSQYLPALNNIEKYIKTL